MASLEYRADIDGLRAVAVVPVVLFHLGLSVAPGGFVGVDVFFVISGYLITSIIAREVQEGRFSLATFYERRIRRIFPALFVVIAATLAVAPVFFLAEDLRNTAQSAGAATLFVSNFLFFHEAGYFDAAAYTKPLLHTWSLAIEEQFYIVMPLLLMALARFGGRMALVVGALTAGSFALSALTTEAMPSAAYYLLPWRAWELGLGALVALGGVPALRGRAVREAAAAIGLAMILAAVVTIDKSTAFPGSAAALPVVGAALILQAGRFGPTAVGRLLSMAGPVWIGRLSYSFYLWHWPVIVFYVYWTMDLPSVPAAAGLFALALALAWASWRFVEQPFRRPAGVAPRLVVFGTAGGAMAAILAVAAVIHVGRGFPERLPEEAQRLAAFAEDKDPRAGVCLHAKNREESWEDPCIYGAEGATTARVALWGDSHAGALIPALDAAGKRAGVGVALYARAGCPPVEGFEWHRQEDNHRCAEYLRRSASAIMAAPEIETVVLALRSAQFTEGWIDVGFGERGRPPILIGTPEAPLPDDADRTAFVIDGLAATITTLQDAGKRVVLVYPIPETGNSVPASLVRFVFRGGEPDMFAIPRALFERRNGRVLEAYDRLAAETGIETVRPHETLCTEEVCKLVADGIPLYYDTNHLSRSGAIWLSPIFDPVFGARLGG